MMMRAINQPLPLWGQALRAVMIAFGALFAVIFITVPMDGTEQAYLTVFGIAVFLILNRFKSRRMGLVLAVFSGVVTMRYLYWRATETIAFDSWFQLILSIGLIAAEVYAGALLLLAYVQTTFPLDRKPVPLPADPADWPTIDIYVPSYNESLDLVRPTVLAAMNIDWPRDKVNVWILDDGRREPFRAFAEAAGCGYIIRPDNIGAKAGNINHALKHTDGEFIAIFDCDHAPTRAFLQMTVGWLVRDARIALVQTPHYFYSADPFERNLGRKIPVPNEGLLFYGVIQPGNDLWNAAFFCGSAAVIRREALEEIGGVPHETVTEDCHCSFRMQQRGWHTAYLRVPLIAGLATERLALHVGQRLRWGRGMLQILRRERTPVAAGLRPIQRLCYFAASFSFMFSLPRLIFLTSPLAFLFFGQNVIAASPLAIIAYAGSHIFHTFATTARFNGRHRHSFWSEIYEAVMALPLLPVTLMTLWNPSKGKFNVTDKGGTLEQDYLDLRIVGPHVVLLLALVTGVCIGLWGIFTTTGLTFQAYLLNTIWCAMCIIPVSASIAVGREHRQSRIWARAEANVPAELVLPDGERIPAHSSDLSLSGARMTIERPLGVGAGDTLVAAFSVCDEIVELPSKLLHWDGDTAVLEFERETLGELSNITRVFFGRPDAWLHWDHWPLDHPLRSLGEVVVCTLVAVFRRYRFTVSRASAVAAPLPGRVSDVVRPRHGAAKAAVRSVAIVAALLLGSTAMARAAPAASDSHTPAAVRPGLGYAPAAPPAAAPPAPNTGPGFGYAPAPPAPAGGPGFGYAPAASPAAAPAAGYAPAPASAVAPAAPGTTVGVPPGAIPPPPGGAPVPASAPAAAPGPAPAAGARSAEGVRQVTRTLRDLGLTGPMQMRGTSDLQGVLFGIRADEVVTAAKLTVFGGASPALIPSLSQIAVTLNDQAIGTIPMDSAHQNFGPLSYNLDPLFFTEINRLNFHFSGRYAVDCNDPLSGLLWATISDMSTVTLTIAQIPQQHDLARLPEPFFDRRELRTALNLPFILPDTTGMGGYRAAAIAASWFAGLADFRGANFPVMQDAPATGNAVLLSVGGQAPPDVTLPNIEGPTLAVLPNPNDRFGDLLLVAGRTEAEAVTAAMALTRGVGGLSGDVAQVQAEQPPPPRPYVAPHWLSPDHPVQLGTLVDEGSLQSYGFAPGPVRVPLRTAPDLYTWRNGGLPLNLYFRAPPAPIIDLSTSRLDVLVSQTYLRSFPLGREHSWLVEHFLRWLGLQRDRLRGQTTIPPYLMLGQQELQMRFDMRPLSHGQCAGVPGDIRATIDPDSTVDISRASRYARMPNLGFFASAGFPFTRLADLSDTAAVLPDHPTTVEATAFLDMIGRLSAITGVPSTGLAVIGPGALESMASRDLLVFGAVDRQPALATLLRDGPLQVSGRRLTLALPGPLQGVRTVLLGAPGSAELSRASLALDGAGDGAGILVGRESPLTAGKSVVAITGMTPAAVSAAVDTVRSATDSWRILGDVTLVQPGQIAAFRTDAGYDVGHLPIWLWAQRWLGDSPIRTGLMLVVAAFIVGFPLHWMLRRQAAVRLRARTPKPPSKPSPKPL